MHTLRLAQFRVPLAALTAVLTLAAAAPNSLGGGVAFNKHKDGVIHEGETLGPFYHDDIVFECPQPSRGFASLQLGYDDHEISVPGTTLHQVNLRVEVRETGRLLAENNLPGAYKVVRFHYDACAEGLQVFLTGVDTGVEGDRFHVFFPCAGVHTQGQAVWGCVGTG